MGKYLQKPCEDVRLLGFRVYQYINPEDEKWYAFIELNTELIDEDGNRIDASNPTDNRQLLISGADAPLSMLELKEQSEVMYDMLTKKYISGKIEMAGANEDSLIEAGYNVETVKEILSNYVTIA